MVNMVNVATVLLVSTFWSSHDSSGDHNSVSFSYATRLSLILKILGRAYVLNLCPRPPALLWFCTHIQVLLTA